MIVKQCDILGNSLLQVFDLRRMQLSSSTEDSYDLGEIDEVEDAVNECAIAMVYKLNDTTFRPLFLRILEWAISPTTKGDQGTLHRQTTWYRFLLRFFDMLKVESERYYTKFPTLIALLQSIVTTYAGFIIEDSVKILNTISQADKDSMELWRGVVLTLHKTFEHDQDG